MENLSVFLSYRILHTVVLSSMFHSFFVTSSGFDTKLRGTSNQHDKYTNTRKTNKSILDGIYKSKVLKVIILFI